MRITLIIAILMISSFTAECQTDTIIYYKNSNKINWEGKTLNGRKIGYWKQFDFKDGKIMTERFFNPTDSSVFETIYQQGKISSRGFKKYINDSIIIDHGYGESYSLFDNKFISSSGYYFNGKLNGILKSFDPITHLPQKVVNVVNDVYVDSFFNFHSNGKLEEMGKFDSTGCKIGMWSTFYENGIIESIGQYTNSYYLTDTVAIVIEGIPIHTTAVTYTKIGLWKYYDKNGKLFKVVFYDKNGKIERIINGKKELRLYRKD